MQPHKSDCNHKEILQKIKLLTKRMVPTSVPSSTISFYIHTTHALQGNAISSKRIAHLNNITFEVRRKNITVACRKSFQGKDQEKIYILSFLINQVSKVISERQDIKRKIFLNLMNKKVSVMLSFSFIQQSWIHGLWRGQNISPSPGLERVNSVHDIWNVFYILQNCFL